MSPLRLLSFQKGSASMNRVDHLTCSIPPISPYFFEEDIFRETTRAAVSTSVFERVALPFFQQQEPIAFQPVLDELKISSLHRKNSWCKALEIALQPFSKDSIPVVFLQKLADIHIALSKQACFPFPLQHVWSVSHEIVTDIEQASEGQWNGKSVQAVFNLIDYICAHNEEANSLLHYFSGNQPYQDTTLAAFLQYVKAKHDEVCASQFAANQKIGRPLQQSYNLNNLQELFLGGRYQSIPLGLIRYVKQYHLFLQHITTSLDSSPNREQARKFAPLFHSQTIRFSMLHTSLNQTLKRVLTS
jgi:hypothetical protein